MAWHSPVLDLSASFCSASPPSRNRQGDEWVDVDNYKRVQGGIRHGLGSKVVRTDLPNCGESGYEAGFLTVDRRVSAVEIWLGPVSPSRIRSSVCWRHLVAVLGR